jgi:glc operon protein GlcG
MLRLMSAAAAAALLLAPQSATAQQMATAAAAPPAYGLPIGHDAAMKAIAAAEAEAKKNNWLMVISVVDSGGRLVAFSRMDNAQLGSIDIAMGKAMTANNLRRPTKDLQDLVGQGGSNLRLLAAPGVTPLEGGVPIVADGKIIGAIGVSGAASNQDAQCAMAGAAAAVGK